MGTTLDYVKAQLPDYADTYVKDMLSRTQAYTDVNKNPYQQYTGERVAGFTGLQNQAFQGAANMGPSQYGEQGAGIAALAANQALGAGSQFQPGQFSNQYQGIGSPIQNQFTAPGAYQSAQITSQNFGQPQAQEYMSPYMQSVVSRQQDDAQRQADVATTYRNAEATGKGAFGGSRQAIMDAEAGRNLAEQKGDIQAQGLQSAFTNAQTQFNADQGRNLVAQQGTEQSRQYGAGQGLTAAGMGAQYGNAAQQLNMTDAQNRATFGAQAQQLGEQSRQYGAGLGLQGANTALQGASALGNIGNQQFNQAKDVSGLQYLYGASQQQNQQAQNDVNYQNFQAAQQYPQQMLGFQSTMLNGLPMSGSAGSTTTAEAPNYGNAILGGMASLAGKFLAKGGAVADGGEPGLMALMASKYARG